MPSRRNTKGDSAHDEKISDRLTEESEGTLVSSNVPTFFASGIASAAVVADFGRAAEAARRHRSRGVNAIARSLEKDFQTQRVAGLRADSELTRRLAKADATATQRWSNAEAKLTRDALSRQAQTRAVQRGVERTGLWYAGLIGSSLPLFAVFGRRNTNYNLTLLGLLVVWGYGDALTSLLSNNSVSNNPEELQKAADANTWWHYAAPFANLLAGWWLLKDRQHEKFVTGIEAGFELRATAHSAESMSIGRRAKPAPADTKAEATQQAHASIGAALTEAFEDLVKLAARCGQPRRFETYAAVVELAPHVAPDFALDVLTLKDVPAVASLVDLRWNSALSKTHADAKVEALGARVKMGNLYLSITVSAHVAKRRSRRLLESVRLAWMVDVLS